MKRFLLSLLLASFALPAHASLWYVNPPATGSNNGTSWANGWVALDQIVWASVQPGDTIYLHGGDNPAASYTYTGSFLFPLTITKSGTSANPITIAASSDAGHNGVAILAGQYVDLQGNSYITFQGNVNGEQHIWLTDFFNTTERTFGNKIVADGTTGFVLDHCVASNVNQCVSLVGARGFNIVANVLESRGDAAVRAVNCPDLGFNSHFIQNNTIIVDYCTNCGAGVFGPDGVQGSHGLTVRSNLFTVRRVGFYTSTQHPDYTQIIGNHTIISANTFLNIVDSGCDFDWVFNPTPHDILIYNNLYNIDTAIDPFPEYIRWYASQNASLTSIDNVQIVANTFANNSTWPNLLGGWSAKVGGPAVSNFRIADNIFYGGSFFISNSPSLLPGSLTLSNNVYAPGQTYSWRGTNYTGAQMVAGGSGPDQAGVSGVPTFVSASDFHLASTNSVGWAHALNYNSLFTLDKDSVVRGATWDVGAYQFVGASTNTPPNVPSNVTPANGATGVSPTPTLVGSAYSDPQGNSQTGAQFQIYAADGTTLVADSFNIGAVNLWLSDVTLAWSTTYKWRWQVGSTVGFSGFSALTSFTTMAQPPSHVKLKIDVLKTHQGKGKP